MRIQIDETTARSVIRNAKWKVKTYKDDLKNHGEESTTQPFYETRIKENETIIAALEYALGDEA